MTGPEAEAAGAQEYARVTACPVCHGDPRGMFAGWGAGWVECPKCRPSPAPVVLSPGQRRILKEVLFGRIVEYDRAAIALQGHPDAARMAEGAAQARELAALLEGVESVVVGPAKRDYASLKWQQLLQESATMFEALDAICNRSGIDEDALPEGLRRDIEDGRYLVNEICGRLNDLAGEDSR